MISKQHFVLLFALFTALGLNAQTKIKDGTITSPAVPNASAILELESNNKGLLLPRMTLAQRDGMSSVPEGLVIFNTTDSCINQYNRGRWNSLCDYVEPWWNKSDSTPSKSLTHHLFHLGSVNVGTGFSSGSYSMTIGSYDSASANYSLAVGELNKIRSTADHSIVAGRNNQVQRENSAVFGENNIDSSSHSIISGYNNTIGVNNEYSGIFGRFNRIGNSSNPGNTNFVFGVNDTILGGSANFVTGLNNSIKGSLSSRNFVSGLNNQILNNVNGSIVGGQTHILNNSSFSAVFGNNNESNSQSTFISGINNTINSSSNYSSIIGGNGNQISGSQSLTFGSNNILHNPGSTVYTTVLGYDNKDSSSNNFISGLGNIIGKTSNYSAIIGRANNISGTYSFIYGELNNITANNSYIIGRNNTVNHQNSMVLGRNGSTTAEDQLILGFTNGVVLPKKSTPPTSPVEGQLYYNTTNKTTFVWNGTEWKALY